ncbi:HIT family protein [Deinococcus sp.]|uniref:HIT family protein n=1 Tax=Deinococcus sp. TaxID=47478 RepID=UPI003B5A3AAE
MTTWDEYIARGLPGRLEAARRGENPTVIARLESGWAVLGDSQLLPGYALLLADPEVESLEALAEAQQMTFLAEMTRLGRAIQAATGCQRVNYGIFGNYDPYLHAHIWARYAWEDEERRQHPVWLYAAEERFAPDALFDVQRHAELLERVRSLL